MTTMTAAIPERVALWTVANHDTYATLHRPDGTLQRGSTLSRNARRWRAC